MSSSKSVSDGSMPQWMKSRSEASINLDDLSAMTPPAHDEPFFHIRLPIAKRVSPKVIERSSSDIESTIGSLNLETDVTSVKAVDFSQECKKYYDGIENAFAAKVSKSKGTDDDFKTAACAGSLVNVAKKFVGGKLLSKRFTIAKIEEHTDHAPPNDENEDTFHNDPNLMQRRNSRSLPASPLGSPKAMRKFQAQPNPYFTMTGSEVPQQKQSWFLTSLFGVRRELTTSTMSVSSQIDEADEMVETSSTQNSTSSTTTTNTTSNTDKQQQPALKKLSAADAKPQPTMLREMNFWTPTSY